MITSAWRPRRIFLFNAHHANTPSRISPHAGILIFIMSSQQSDSPISESDPEVERWIERGETLSESEQPTEAITTNETSCEPDRSVEGSDRSCSLLDDYALLLSHE